MRVLIFHGYLLRGTGSNVYNARLAAALRSLGHEVHLLCQDREPDRLEFVDAVGEWHGGRLQVRELRTPQCCVVYRPDIGPVLPLYVADRYPGIESRPFPELSDEEVASYVERNVAAVRDVVERARPDVALANHLIMGPAILARALEGTGVPYAIKIHGSALEYTVKPHPERFMSFAREGLDGGAGVLVGSRHTAESLWAAMRDPDLPDRTRLGPPGVDVATFAPRESVAATAGLHALGRRLRETADGAPELESSFSSDPRAAGSALARIDPGTDRIVAFTGKLILAKGVDLLLAAFPLVLAREPAARLVVVGFGAWRAGAEAMTAALAAGDLEAVRKQALAGRGAEGGPPGPLRYLLAFLDSLDAEARADYVAAARAVRERVVFTGRLEHAELADLLPACEAQVVPSTFPEAFGMVAAEAAACGALPVSADHSGLAEVTATLADVVPAPARELLAFPLGDRAVHDLADRLIGWLGAPEDLRADTRAILAATARELYSWEGVGRGVIAAAEGRLDELPSALLG